MAITASQQGVRAETYRERATTMAADFPQPSQQIILEWNVAARRFELVEIVGE